MIDFRALIMRAGQRLGQAWFRALADALGSLVVVTGEESQVQSEHTVAGQLLSLTRPIPGPMWGKAYEAIPARDGDGYWGSGLVTLYLDFKDEDGEPYSELGGTFDRVKAWNRTAVAVPINYDVMLEEVGGEVFVKGVVCPP